MNYLKNINKNKRTLVAILSLVLTVCVCFAVVSYSNNTVNVRAYNAVIPQEVVADEYNLGTTVIFPSEIEIEYEGQTLTATDGYIVYPDGKATYVGNIALNQLGEYSISYYFVVNGKTHIVKKVFSVTDKLYSLSSDNGSIVAVSSEEQQNKTYVKSEDNVTLTNQDALIVRLAEKNVFNYSKSIDLTDVGEDGLCDIISIDYNLSNFELLDGYENRASWKKYSPTKESATYCVIRLTDSYDASNYVELYLTADFPYTPYPQKYNPSYNFIADATYQSSYRGIFTACAINQKRTGMMPFNGSEWGGYKKVTIDGKDYGAYIDNIFGTHGNMTLGQSLTQDHVPYTWAYDYKTNNVYLKVGDQTVLITSLSNSDLYGESIFGGFSKDKVKISIFMTEYVTDAQGRVDIFSIGNDDGATLVESFGKSGFVDDVAVPEIDLGVETTDFTGIYAPIGSSFAIPKATVIGGNANGSYNVSVYSNYGTESQMDVPVVDGKITIQKNIQYSVVYSASNSAGGVATKVLKINPVLTVEKPITLTTDFDITQVEAGETVVLPEYSYSTINRIDLLSVNIKAVHEKETIKINLGQRSFVPSYAGEYKIIYELTDNAFTVVEEFALTCVASNNVGFSGDVVTPKYFIKGATYSLEPAQAYSYAKGYPAPISVKAFISFDGGAYTEIADINSVKITGSSTANLKYTCQDGGQVGEIFSSDIEIIDVNYSQRNNLVVKNFFKHDDFTIMPFDLETNRKTDVKFDAKATSGNGTLEFINAIDLTKLNVQFKTTKDFANYGAIKVILTDYYDKSKTFSVEMTNGNPYCITSYNGLSSVRSGHSFASDTVNKTVIYSHDLKKLTVNDVSYSLDLSTHFTSNLCYVSIVLCDINGSASVIIDSINGQGFRQKYSNNNDSTSPIISYLDFSGEYTLGSTIKISVPVVTDVLTPVLKQNIKLTVKKDDGYAVSVDGVKLDATCNPFSEYELKLDEQGRYQIVYTAIDGFGNETIANCYVSVVDNTAPAIKFVKDYQSNITRKVGEVIDLSVRVYDDYTPDNEIETNVLIQDLKSGTYYSISDYKVKFGYEGDFEIYVTAKDKTGNFSSVKVVVSVVK